MLKSKKKGTDRRKEKKREKEGVKMEKMLKKGKNKGEYLVKQDKGNIPLRPQKVYTKTIHLRENNQRKWKRKALTQIGNTRRRHEQ